MDFLRDSIDVYMCLQRGETTQRAGMGIVQVFVTETCVEGECHLKGCLSCYGFVLIVLTAS